MHFGMARNFNWQKCVHAYLPEAEIKIEKKNHLREAFAALIDCANSQHRYTKDYAMSDLPRSTKN